MKYKIYPVCLFSLLLTLLAACSDDSSDNPEDSILGSWLVSNITTDIEGDHETVNDLIAKDMAFGDKRVGYIFTFNEDKTYKLEYHDMDGNVMDDVTTGVFSYKDNELEFTKDEEDPPYYYKGAIVNDKLVVTTDYTNFYSTTDVIRGLLPDNTNINPSDVTVGKAVLIETFKRKLQDD